MPFSHFLAKTQGSIGELIDLTGSTGALVDLTLDPVTYCVSSDDESSAIDSDKEMICNSVGTFPSDDSDASSGFPEDVLAHLDEPTMLFAPEKSLCRDEQLELLTIEFDPRVAEAEWETNSGEQKNKRKAESLVEDLEAAPVSKRARVRTAMTHAEIKTLTRDDQFLRLGQATASWIKRK